MHVVKELRMRVQVPPPSGDLGVQSGDAVDDRHGIGSSFGAPPGKRTV
jgi:hypothetical protein